MSSHFANSAENRLKEIIKMAHQLHWINSPNAKLPFDSYPIMQMSEVEKCMLAMVDQDRFKEMQRWCGITTKRE